MRTKTGYSKAIIAVILLTCVAAGLTAALTAAAEAQETAFRAVIIRGAAGHLPDEKPPEGPDAITQATSEPGNTYVFSKRLAGELEKERYIRQPLSSTPIAGTCPCLDYTMPREKRRTVDFVILAGPSYKQVSAEALPESAPRLGEKLASHPGVICSSLISGNYTYRVVDTMVNTDKKLREIGAKTVPGLVFNSDVIEQEIN
jgi:hypothetical protein